MLLKSSLVVCFACLFALKILFSNTRHYYVEALLIFFDISGGTSKSGTIIHHVTDFGNSEASFEEDKVEKSSPKKRKGKNKKKGKKNKKQKIVDDSECANLKKRKKKLKL